MFSFTSYCADDHVATCFLFLFTKIRLWCSLFMHVIHISHWRTFMYLFYLYTVFSPFLFFLLHSRSADALLWHLCEWGLWGWDSKRWFSDRLAMAVMCAVNSQRGLRGVQTREMSVISIDVFPWLTAYTYDPSKVTQKYFGTPILSLYGVLTKGYWRIFPQVIETWLLRQGIWKDLHPVELWNNGISGLECLLYFIALEAKLNYPRTSHSL